MAEAATPFPLKWPGNRARRHPMRRKDGRFKNQTDRGGLAPVTVAVSLSRLEREL